MKDLTLLIMAAGMGSRYGGLKQIDPIGPNNEFIIDYSVYDAIKSGIKKVVFIIKEENYEVFQETIGNRIKDAIEVEYVFQSLSDIPSNYELNPNRSKPWGTGHAILCAKDKVDTNFIVINADDFYGRQSYEGLATFLQGVDEASLNFAMAGYLVKNTVSLNGSVKRGLCKVKDNQLERLEESIIEVLDNKYYATNLKGENKREISEDDIVSMNMFAFTPQIFNELEREFNLFLDKNLNEEKEEFLIPEIVFKLIDVEKATVEVVETNSVWHGVTYQEDKSLVKEAINDLINEGQYPKNLW